MDPSEMMPRELWVSIADWLAVRHVWILSMVCKYFRYPIRICDIIGILCDAIEEGETHLIKYVLRRWPVPNHVETEDRCLITVAVARNGTNKTLRALHDFPLMIDEMMNHTAENGNYSIFAHAWERLYRHNSEIYGSILEGLI